MLGESVADARIASQGLTAPLGGVAEVVHRLVGLQAQDEWVAPYAIRPRAGSTVDAAQVAQAPDLICTWAMRGTLHLMTVADAPWIVGLLGPRLLARHRPRRLQLGLTDDLIERALPVVVARLPATRAEIAAAVRKRRLDLGAGQAEAHLVATAALHGLLHRRGDVYHPMPGLASIPEDPLRALALRYLAGHGPAEAEDFAAWSGLPLTEARHAMRGLSARVAESGPPPTRLLGHLDPLLLGYRDRSFILDPAHAKEIQRGGGFLRPIIVARGRVCGTWSRERKGGRLLITATSFRGKLPDLSEEVADLGRFFGLNAELG